MKTKTRPIYVLCFLLAGGLLVWLATLVPFGQKPEAFPVTLEGSSKQPEEIVPTEPGGPEPQPAEADHPSSGETSARINDRPEAPPGLYFEYLRKAYSHPLDFYGKVVDQDGNPVAGAEVNFTWASPPPNERGYSKIKQSDETGLFSLTGEIGRRLGVRVSKNGYYFPEGQQIGFGYAPEDGNFKSDPKNPIIYRLRKRGPGVELVTSQYGVRRNFDFSLPKDGSPKWIDFFERKVGTSGQMQVSKLTPVRDRTDRRPHEWRLTLSIPDGGFVELTETEFPFYPPEAGYQPVLDFHYPPDREGGWTGTLKRQYYIAFGNPRRYGRIQVEAWSTGGIRLGYVVNPEGSPYLEPKEAVIE